MLFDSFTDTIFYKESSELTHQYEALLKLHEEYPENDEVKESLYNIKKGIDGEKEIRYQLSKSNLGLYVLHDVNLEYEDLKAQIDYVVISKAYCYFIECKNLYGNITINSKGDFIREFFIKGKKIKKGMESPLRQVEAQRDVFKKIWNESLSKNKIINNIKRKLGEDNFTDTYRTLVVAANAETILNTEYAPKEIKYKIIRADGLIRQIQYDLDHSDKEYWSSKNEMEKWAYSFIKLHTYKNINYYETYKEKYIKDETNNLKEEILKERLIEFRKARSKEMKIPAYYVFNNEELEKILETKPRNLEELTKLNILSPIKVKTHGEQIIEIINLNYKQK